MDPRQQQVNQPQQPTQPQQPPVAYSPPTTVPEPQMTTSPLQTVAPEATRKKTIKMPIILMVWPAAAIILTILLYALINFLMGSPSPADGDTFGDTSPLKSALNILLFIVGGVSVIFGPISFIVGLVILIVRKTK